MGTPFRSHASDARSIEGSLHKRRRTIQKGNLESTEEIWFVRDYHSCPTICRPSLRDRKQRQGIQGPKVSLKRQCTRRNKEPQNPSDDSDFPERRKLKKNQKKAQGTRRNTTRPTVGALQTSVYQKYNGVGDREKPANKDKESPHRPKLVHSSRCCCAKNTYAHKNRTTPISKSQSFKKQNQTDKKHKAQQTPTNPKTPQEC